MYWQTLELAENGRYARLDQGFIVIYAEQQELGRVVLEELSSVLVSAEQATLSKPLLVRLAEEGIPVVLCGSNYHPISIMLPYSVHHRSAQMLQAQIATSKPQQKKLWQHIIKAKIYQQRQALLNTNAKIQPGISKRLQKLASTVGSGDPKNHEAQAARLYWKQMMGAEFSRQQQANDWVNSALNYGYTVLRAACARAIAAAGLQPALGIHHHNQRNPFALADDLMEPFRPYVDEIVLTLTNKRLSASSSKSKVLSATLNVDDKQRLVKVLQCDLQVNKQCVALVNALSQLAYSLAAVYTKEQDQLVLPEIAIN